MLWCHPAVARSLAAEIGTVLVDPTRHRLKDADIETAAFALGILPEHVLAGLSWPNVTKLAEVAVRATGDDYAPQKKLNVLVMAEPIIENRKMISSRLYGSLRQT